MTLYEEDRRILGNIKNEAVYLEQQLSRFKANEDKLLGIMSTAYNKIESLIALSTKSKNDPEARAINKQMR